MNKIFSPKKVLAVFAHPDDEAFGPSGTLALWAKNGTKIHLLCATRGEAGINELKDDTAKIRSAELMKSVKVIGIESVEFLGFIDGEIGNNDLAHLEGRITEKVNQFQPEVLLTFDLNGISGHIDHIAVASATTSCFLKSKNVKKLYYHVNIKEFMDQITDYFIYVPEGKSLDQINEVVDISKVWDIKMLAMQMHQSQLKDIQMLINIWKTMPKKEYFQVKEKASPAAVE